MENLGSISQLEETGKSRLLRWIEAHKDRYPSLRLTAARSDRTYQP